MKSSSIAVLATFLALGFLACTSQQGADSPAPEVRIEQVGRLMALGVQPSGGIPMQYRLTITNPLDHEVRLVSVEVQSVGGAGGYTMNRVRHAFDQVIAARGSHHLDFRAWVRVATEGEMRSVDHPVLIQGLARFAGPAGSMTRNFSARVNDHVD